MDKIIFIDYIKYDPGPARGILVMLPSLFLTANLPYRCFQMRKMGFRSSKPLVQGRPFESLPPGLRTLYMLLLALKRISIVTF